MYETATQTIRMISIIHDLNQVDSNQRERKRQNVDKVKTKTDTFIYFYFFFILETGKE